MNTIQTLSISQLRAHAAKAVHTVIATKNPTIIFQRSQPKAVLVDYYYYQALEEAVLDATDSAEAERAKNEPSDTLSSYLVKRWGKSSP